MNSVLLYNCFCSLFLHSSYCWALSTLVLKICYFSHKGPICLSRCMSVRKRWLPVIVPGSGWRGGSPFFHPLEERCRLVEALILRCGHVLTWPIGGHGGPASPAVGVMLGPVSLRTCPAVPQGRTEEWDCRPAHTRHYQMLSSVLLPLCVFIGNVLAFLLHCISFKIFPYSLKRVFLFFLSDLYIILNIFKHPFFFLEHLFCWLHSLLVVLSFHFRAFDRLENLLVFSFMACAFWVLFNKILHFLRSEKQSLLKIWLPPGTFWWFFGCYSWGWRGGGHLMGI